MKDPELFDWTAPDPPAPKKTRAEEHLEAFEVFHAANPRVWELFQEFAFIRIREGFAHYSAQGIIERIRWDVACPTEGEGEVKINNNFCAFYPRLFNVAHPSHEGFFKLRRMISADRPARGDGGEVFLSGKPGDEEKRLLDRLRALL